MPMQFPTGIVSRLCLWRDLGSYASTYRTAPASRRMFTPAIAEEVMRRGRLYLDVHVLTCSDRHDVLCGALSAHSARKEVQSTYGSVAAPNRRFAGGCGSD